MYSFLNAKKAEPSGIFSEALVINFIFPLSLSVSMILFLLKVSEMLFLKEQTGSFPILLLDDLFAKIDLERSIKIVTILNKIGVDQKTKAQTIITTTDILNVEKSGLLKDYNNTKTIKLER